MVKLNLLYLPEHQEEYLNTSPESNAADGFLFNDSQDTSEAFDYQKKASQDFYSSEMPSSTNPDDFQSSPDIDNFPGMGSRGTGHFSPPLSPRSGFKKNTIIAAIVLGIILVASFFVFRSSGNSPVVAIPPASSVNLPPKNRNLPPSKSTSGKKRSSKFTFNQKENLFYVDYLQKFFTTRVPNMGYTIMVVTPGYMYMSVLSESGEALKEYQKTIRNEYPHLKLEIENSGNKLVNGQRKWLTDFSVAISDIFSDRSSSYKTTYQPEEIEALFSTHAQKHRLQMTYFQQGEQDKTKKFTKTKYYINLTGQSSYVFNYLKQLSQNYPEILIHKISLYPSNSSTMNTGNIKSRIELAFFSPSTI